MNKFDKYFVERSISYEGKTVAVTGATGSLGYYISRYVLLKGAKLIIVGRNEKKIQTTINELKKEYPDINIYVFVVHTTKTSAEDAKILFDSCDVATACASKHIREIGQKESIRTVGQSIPIYAKTEDGKRFLELRLERIGGEKPKKDNPDLPYPLI